MVGEDTLPPAALFAFVTSPAGYDATLGYLIVCPLLARQAAVKGHLAREGRQSQPRAGLAGAWGAGSD